MRSIGLGELRIDVLAQAIRDLMLGGSHVLGEAELSTGTETTVNARDCGPSCKVFVQPTSSGAASAGVWVKQVDRELFKLGHAAGASGRTVSYELRRP